MLIEGGAKIELRRRDPVFVALGVAMVALAVVPTVLVWPYDLPPDCADPLDLPPGVTLSDGYDCTNHPVREAIRANAPVSGPGLLAALGVAAITYGVRKHPSG